jgi:hypothetical protein
LVFPRARSGILPPTSTQGVTWVPRAPKIAKPKRGTSQKKLLCRERGDPRFGHVGHDGGRDRKHGRAKQLESDVHGEQSKHEDDPQYKPVEAFRRQRPTSTNLVWPIM